MILRLLHVYFGLITHLKGKRGAQIIPKTQLQQNNWFFFRFIIVLVYHLGKGNNRVRAGEVLKIEVLEAVLIRTFTVSYCSPCNSSKLTWTRYDLLSAVQENLN